MVFGSGDGDAIDQIASMRLGRTFHVLSERYYFGEAGGDNDGNNHMELLTIVSCSEQISAIGV